MFYISLIFVYARLIIYLKCAIEVSNIIIIIIIIIIVIIITITCVIWS